MQAWDSVKIRADIELGGTEQLYSFMLARDLQKEQGLSPQIGVMSPILAGPRRRAAHGQEPRQLHRHPRAAVRHDEEVHAGARCLHEACTSSC